MRRSTTTIDFEQLENAMNLAYEGVRAARKCVRRAARLQARRDNARHGPGCRTGASRKAPERIGPAPGYVPEEMPPVGEKWVHMGDGVFVTQRVYKRQLKHQQQKEREQGWNS